MQPYGERVQQRGDMEEAFAREAYHIPQCAIVRDVNRRMSAHTRRTRSFRSSAYPAREAEIFGGASCQQSIVTPHI